MGKNIIWESKVNADLFDPEFPMQLQIDPATLPPKEQSFFYELKVKVSVQTAGFSDQINRFFLPDSVIRNCKTEMDRYSEILSVQISSVLKLFRDFGFIISNAAISGSPIEPVNMVCLQLLQGNEKEYDKRGKLIVPITAISIIPDALWLRNQVIHFYQSEIVNSIKQQARNEIAKAIHPRQQTPLSFSDLVQRLFSAKGLKTKATAEMILETAQFHQKAPVLAAGNLKMPSKYGAFPEVSPPEWMIYLEKKDGTWQIETYSRGIDAQNRLVSIWKRDHVRAALALYDLVPIKYSFAAHTEYGLVYIAPIEAKVYDQIQTVWSNDPS